MAVLINDMNSEITLDEQCVSIVPRKAGRDDRFLQELWDTEMSIIDHKLRRYAEYSAYIQRYTDRINEILEKPGILSGSN